MSAADTDQCELTGKESEIYSFVLERLVQRLSILVGLWEEEIL